MHRLRFASFNILASLFGAFSIMTVVPFLQIIFNLNPSSASPKPSLAAQTGLLNEANTWLRLQIIEWGSFYSLVFFSCMLVVMFLLKNLSLYIAFTGLSHMRAGISKHLRDLMYHKLLKLPMSFYSSERKGDLITRATNDVREVEWSFIGVLEMVLKHPFMLLIPFGLLFYISWQLTLFVVIVLPLSGYIISRLAKKLKKAARLGTEKLGDVISQFEETLGGIKIIKAFNAEGKSSQHFDEKNNDQFRLTKKLDKPSSPIKVLRVWGTGSRGQLVRLLQIAHAGRFLWKATEAFPKICKNSQQLQYKNSISRCLYLQTTAMRVFA